MDLDTTLKNLPLTPEVIEKALQEIFEIDLDDDVKFNLKGISPIREDDIYGGYRVALDAIYETIVTPMTIDVSTGDVITPNAVRFNFTGIFDDELKFELWAYNIETVLAEKVETILRRNVFNTKIFRAFFKATEQELNTYEIHEFNIFSAHFVAMDSVCMSKYISYDYIRKISPILQKENYKHLANYIKVRLFKPWSAKEFCDNR